MPRAAAELARLLEQALAWRSARSLSALARSLGVSTASLERLGIGWLPQAELARAGEPYRSGAWAIPMRAAGGALLGLRLRFDDGRKRAVRGSKNGLFVPDGIKDRPAILLVAEGESDTAALLDMDFDVIGRPGCQGGTAMVVAMARQLRARQVVVVADGDEPGRQGAERLVQALRRARVPALVITPPTDVKDARAWKAAGATRLDVEAAITSAPILSGQRSKRGV